MHKEFKPAFLFCLKYSDIFANMQHTSMSFMTKKLCLCQFMLAMKMISSAVAVLVFFSYAKKQIKKKKFMKKQI